MEIHSCALMTFPSVQDNFSFVVRAKNVEGGIFYNFPGITEKKTLLMSKPEVFHIFLLPVGRNFYYSSVKFSLHYHL